MDKASNMRNRLNRYVLLECLQSIQSFLCPFCADVMIISQAVGLFFSFSVCTIHSIGWCLLVASWSRPSRQVTCKERGFLGEASEAFSLTSFSDPPVAHHGPMMSQVVRNLAVFPGVPLVLFRVARFLAYSWAIFYAKLIELCLDCSLPCLTSITGWWWLEHGFDGFPYFGQQKSHLTNSIIFQRGRWQPPTRYKSLPSIFWSVPSVASLYATICCDISRTCLVGTWDPEMVCHVVI